MPVSYSPDIRIRELEKLLQNNRHLPEGNYNKDYYGLWTKKDLAEKITEIFDLKRTISEKTIENDLKKMEVEYNAPIDKKDIFINVYNENGNTKSVRKVAYFYYDKNISIFSNNNLQPDDLKNLRTVISILKQFKGFKHFEDVDLLIDKLQIRSIKNTYPDIFFETVDSYAGIEHIDIIARAVKERYPLKIRYKAFDMDKAVSLTIHPYQLREFNNRWFVLAATEEYNERVLGVYGLERIMETPVRSKVKFKMVAAPLIKDYFKDIIGVTNFNDNKVETIIFEVTGIRAEYVVTKPWHHSQELIKEKERSKQFKINVKINNELIAHILSFGDDIHIIKPESLKQIIKDKLSRASGLYN